MAGRDKDGYFVVIGLDEDYALICDGKVRKLDKPKKKKLKHLSDTGKISGFISDKLKNESRITNSEIRRAIGMVLKNKTV